MREAIEEGVLYNDRNLMELRVKLRKENFESVLSQKAIYRSEGLYKRGVEYIQSENNFLISDYNPGIHFFRYLNSSNLNEKYDYNF